MSKPKLLWWGDAVAPTGFARVTHEILERLKDRWDVHVLGLNYHGDPHHYDYPIFPARLGLAQNPFGIDRAKSLCDVIKPDVVVANNDPWNVSLYMKVLPPEVPVVGYLPVDGRNCFFGQKLNGLAHLIGYTQFGIDEMIKSGYTGPSSVIPHGVDSKLFRPIDDKIGLRTRLGLDAIGSDLFIVGNVNRNQPRKRQDLTIQYFADWWRRAGMPSNARLYFHYAGQAGWNLVQMARFYGVAQQLMQSHDQAGADAAAVSDEDLCVAYNLFDVHVSTTQGEGWGLTAMEAMACGVPNILPDWSAFGEWAKDAAYLVPCTTTAATAQGVNVIGGVADREKFVEALDVMYRSRDMREEYGRRGRALVTEPRFAWSDVAERFHAVLTDVHARAQYTKGQES